MSRNTTSTASDLRGQPSRRGRAIAGMLRRNRRPMSIEAAAKLHASHVRPAPFRTGLR